MVPFVAHAADADWQGVDDKFEEIAKSAGHPAREPYINCIQGDLGLFMFFWPRGRRLHRRIHVPQFIPAEVG